MQLEIDAGIWLIAVGSKPVAVGELDEALTTVSDQRDTHEIAAG